MCIQSRVQCETGIGEVSLDLLLVACAVDVEELVRRQPHGGCRSSEKERTQQGCGVEEGPKQHS